MKEETLDHLEAPGEPRGAALLAADIYMRSPYKIKVLMIFFLPPATRVGYIQAVFSK